VPEKFYKVFVSSTYEDLKEERQEVFDALLKCSCFPVGMEHFPSSNLRSLDLIRKYIDQCDYYVMVSAGVYGSIVPGRHRKVSYVEWEYDYAKDKLPCFSFIIQDPNKLLGDKLEKDNWDLLVAFHGKVKRDGRNVRSYTSAAQLNALVLHAFQNAPRDTPATGWIRAGSLSVSNGLVGTWKLVSSNRPEWEGSTIIKMFSANEFMWLQVDGDGSRHFVWGYYEREPYYGMIREIPRETSFADIKEEVQEYAISVDGNVLTTRGKRSTGVHVAEEFRRLNLSVGVDVLGNPRQTQCGETPPP
jgi:hypothetical protein